MSIDTLIQSDTASFLAHFGESVQYRKKADPTHPVTITAVIDRDPPRNREQDSKRSLSLPIEVDVRVSDIATVEVNGDAIKLPVRLGGTAEWLPVTSVLKQDSGFWHLAVGR